MIKLKLFHTGFCMWGRTNPTCMTPHVSVLEAGTFPCTPKSPVRFCQHKTENLKPLHFTSGSCRRVGEGWQLNAAWRGQNVWFLTQNNTSHVHVFSKTFKLNRCRHSSQTLQALRDSEDGTKGISGKMQPPGFQAVQVSASCSAVIKRTCTSLFHTAPCAGWA